MNTFIQCNINVLIDLWKTLGSKILLVALVCIFSVNNYYAFVKKYSECNKPSIFGLNSPFAYICIFFIQLCLYYFANELLSLIFKGIKLYN